MPNVSSIEVLPGPDVHAAITTVEEATCLLDSYLELLFDTHQRMTNDAEASGKIYALLVAARSQLDRLRPVPEVLMRARRMAVML